MRKAKKILKVRKIAKNNKKKNNFKKIFLSSLAVFSLAATVGISNLGINGSNNSIVSTNTSRSADTTTYMTPPQTNDLYDDYAYANGFVSISGSVINFYDWFGFKMWSYDVNANAGSLFGNQNLKISTLKVRSSTDGNSIYVYGYFSDDTSYLFALNTADGSISPIAGKNAYTNNDGLIQDVNLLTIMDGCLILTPKSPVATSSTSAVLNFSLIDLSSGSETNNAYDLSPLLTTTKGYYIIKWGEIIGVQKVSTRYCFEIAVVRSTKGDTTQSSPSIIYAYFVNGAANVASSSAVGWWSTADQSYIDVDQVSCNVLNVANPSGTISTFIVPKYDTTTTTLGYPGTPPSSTTTTPATQTYYKTASLVADSTLSSDSFAISTFQFNSVNGSNDTVAGITNFLFDQSTNTPYVVLADANSTTKLAIAPMSGGKAGSAPGWIDLTSLGVQENANQILSLGFIPSTSDGTTISGGYAGYLDVKTQSNLSISDLTDSDAFISLNSSGTAITPLSLGFSYAVSDSDIDNKYKFGKYKANDTTKASLISDLIQVNFNGSPYNGVTYTSTIVADPTSNTLKGNVVLTIPNWWNSDTTQLTRSVNIDLNAITINTDVTVRKVSVMVYAAIVLAILVIIAALLVLIKVILKKRASELLIENQTK